MKVFSFLKAWASKRMTWATLMLKDRRDCGGVHAPPTQSKVEKIVHIGMSGGCCTVVDFTSW